MVLPSGEKSSGACYTLVGRVVFEDALDKAAKFVSIDMFPAFFLGTLEEFLEGLLFS